MTSDTPRTDAASFDAEMDTSDQYVQSSCNVKCVDVEFASELERELTTANETIARLDTDLQQHKALLESKLTLLASCETALDQRDAKLATKEAELLACRADAAIKGSAA